MPGSKSSTRKSSDQGPASDPTKVASDGFASAMEHDENSIAVSDPGYVGVSPEYMNYADETNAPFVSEDAVQGSVEEAAKQREVDAALQASKVGFQGYSVDTPHPSEARSPAEDYIEANRAWADELRESAKERQTDREAAAESADAEDEGASSSPGIVP